MGIKDTKMEAELENNIIEYLVSNQGYKYIKPDEMKRDFWNLLRYLSQMSLIY